VLTYHKESCEPINTAKKSIFRHLTRVSSTSSSLAVLHHILDMVVDRMMRRMRGLKQEEI